MTIEQAPVQSRCILLTVQSMCVCVCVIVCDGGGLVTVKLPGPSID